MNENMGDRVTMAKRGGYIGIFSIITFMTSFGKLVKRFLNRLRACKRGLISYWVCHKYGCIPDMGQLKCFILIGENIN